MDLKLEVEKRVQFIKDKLEESHSNGIVFGNSGGKDCALVGILCKMACDNTVSIIMPCYSKLNYTSDKTDAEALCKTFNIECRVVDLTMARATLLEEYKKITTPNNQCLINIAPRLRMTTLYAIGASENRLVAGTGNRSERFIGYFTKWGDGGCDFNPISDLTVHEVYDMLRYLKCPEQIINKVPSASLYEGQTDEKEIGMTYAEIDKYILERKKGTIINEKLESMHSRTKHKRVMPSEYNPTGDDE